jgi:hypothetical protein
VASHLLVIYLQQHNSEEPEYNFIIYTAKTAAHCRMNM